MKDVKPINQKNKSNLAYCYIDKITLKNMYHLMKILNTYLSGILTRNSF